MNTHVHTRAFTHVIISVFRPLCAHSDRGTRINTLAPRLVNGIITVPPGEDVLRIKQADEGKVREQAGGVRDGMRWR